MWFVPKLLALLLCTVCTPALVLGWGSPRRKCPLFPVIQLEPALSKPESHSSLSASFSRCGGDMADTLSVLDVPRDLARGFPPLPMY